MIHDIGIIVLGSQLENHGAVLPTDTDTKIAMYVAIQAGVKTGAKLVGIVNPACEYEYIKHGKHFPVNTVLDDLRNVVKNAISRLGIHKFIIVNGHGGNKLIFDGLKRIEDELNVKIKFNNSLVDLEGAHAGTGEVSIGAVIGIADESKLKEHIDFERYPEVGFVGLKEAHVNEKIREMAREVKREGVKIDKMLGERLVKEAVESIVRDINQFP
jgi:2-amino-5-formylamino-6-ribosylaminopyrimidin-4(3H)-one 5'-monophosphate deformylase